MTTASIFTDFGLDFLSSDTKKNLEIPFKNHPQIPFIIDSLSRYERHHLAFVTNQSEKIHQALMKAVAEHIRSTHVPKPLKECRFIYFDALQFSGMHISKEKIAQDFQTLVAELKNNSQCIIFVINQVDFLIKSDTNFSITYLNHLIKQVSTHNEWRIISFISQNNLLNNVNLEYLFAIAHLIEPHTSDLIALLKANRTQLENFHQVIISDEVITQAHAMAVHYLPGHSVFDKAFELLDSAASRASAMDRIDHLEQKAVVTPYFLTQVISNRTQIPVTYLHNNKFQVSKFTEALRKNVFGQDAAINMMASLLQNACIKLQDNSGSLCNFLLVGPHDVGKTEMAYAMSEHLFGSHNALLQLNLNHKSYTCLADLKILPRLNENTETSLLAAIQQTPYAILLIEDIDQLHKDTFHLIKGIFDQGYLIDEQHIKYDFRHAIIIATTRLTSEQINHTNTPHHSHDNSKSIDLMQLVLNEHVHDTHHQPVAYLSPQELCEELMPKLIEYFPQHILKKFNIIPFIPLDYSVFEKIIRSKIKMLARRLYGSFGIELSFAPEVVKFLAHETLWRKAHVKSLDKLLEQYLYSAVTHEILLHAEDKDRSKRLFIRLNESGELLRCEFITSNEAAFYSL